MQWWGNLHRVVPHTIQALTRALYFPFLGCALGHKVSKRVEFGTQLDLGPFMSDWPQSGHQQYDLYGVLVHRGHR